MSEIVFKADKKHRDKIFTADHFAHPAKMVLPLQRWIIDRYTKPGDVILDPMAGSGTLLVATQTGRHVILIELEQKFIKMIEDNWAKIQTIGSEMGHDMGTAQIIQGDARNLEIALCDVVVTSPPYAIDDKNICHTRQGKTLADYDEQRGFRATSHPTTDYSTNPDNIGNLRYGNIDCVISSPPYEGIEARDRSKEAWWDEERELRFSGGSAKISKGYSIDTIITSPPYEGTTGEGKEIGSEGHTVGAFHYGNNRGQIGNLKGECYLEAMLQVYRECHRVLKPQGLMILVTKNFIRNKEIVRLDQDTIRLCQEAGFEFLERHYRKLTSQSFWRVIYKQKYPDAPEIDKEDILIFNKV